MQASMFVQAIRHDSAPVGYLVCTLLLVWASSCCAKSPFNRRSLVVLLNCRTASMLFLAWSIGVMPSLCFTSCSLACTLSSQRCINAG